MKRKRKMGGEGEDDAEKSEEKTAAQGRRVICTNGHAGRTNGCLDDSQPSQHARRIPRYGHTRKRELDDEKRLAAHMPPVHASTRC